MPYSNFIKYWILPHVFFKDWLHFRKTWYKNRLWMPAFLTSSKYLHDWFASANSSIAKYFEEINQILLMPLNIFKKNSAFLIIGIILLIIIFFIKICSKAFLIKLSDLKRHIQKNFSRKISKDHNHFHYSF